ncbi:MAG: VWA domain-containing protein [Acidobacteriota bacterium]
MKPPSSPPVFRVETALVQVDAVVTDRQGRKVKDLTAGDFEVFQDGVPLPVIDAAYIEQHRPSMTFREAAPPPAPQPALANLQPVQPGLAQRVIVLLADDLNLSFENTHAVRHALRKFVERQMQDGDAVAICRSSGGFFQFTDDRRWLASVADRLSWNLRSFQPLDAQPGTPASPGFPPERLAAWAGPQGASRAHFALFATVMSVIDLLEPLPGRKVVVIFSDGIEPPAAGAAALEEFLRALRRVIDRANRAGVILNTVHAEGLLPLQAGADARLVETPSPYLVHLQLEQLLSGIKSGQRQRIFAKQQTLALLAEATGGRAVENTNDLNWAVDRILEDLDGYYLIACRPPPERRRDPASGAFRRIEVRVKRPGLRVRSRAGLLEPDQEETPARPRPALELLRAAAQSPAPWRQIPLTLAALYSETKQGAVLRCWLHIAAESLHWDSDASGRGLLRLEVLVSAIRGLDEVSGFVAKRYEIPVGDEQSAQVQSVGLRYVLDMPIEKRGPHMVRAVVRDAATGRVGSAARFVMIPDPKKDRVVLSSVVLGGGREEQDRWLGLDTHRFRPGDTLEFAASLVKGDPARLKATVRLWRERELVHEGTALFQNAEGGPVVSGALRLRGDMPAGPYSLQLTVEDARGRRRGRAEQWAEFLIAP